MVSEQLQKKIDRAIRLIKAYAPKDGSPIEVAYSGGKDSDIILQLTKEAGVNYRAIYKNTTIDPKGTIQHVREMGVEVLTPKLNFRQLIEKKGQPSRQRRFCCEYLKEYKVLDKAIIGVRRDESAKRAERYKEPTQCRVYGKNERVEQIMPILDWNTEDIAEYAQDRGIKFAPLYYDEDGNFHPERRLGCVGCPLAARSHRISEFKKYPYMVKLYLKGIKVYMDNHPNRKMVTENIDEYGSFVRDLFQYSKADWNSLCNGVFGRPDFKKQLEDYFNIQLD